MSTDHRSVKLLADSLEEDRRATCEKLSSATGAKPSRENAHEPPQLLVAGPLILHGNARPHIAYVVTKKTSRYWVGIDTSCALLSKHEASRLRLIPKVKRTHSWTFLL